MRLLPSAFVLGFAAFGACQPPLDTSISRDSFSQVTSTRMEEDPLPICVEWTGVVDESVPEQRPAGQYLPELDRCFFAYLQKSGAFQTFGLPSDASVSGSKLPRLRMHARIKALTVQPGFWSGMTGTVSVTFELTKPGALRPFGFYIASFVTGEVPLPSMAYSKAAQAALDRFAHDLDMDRPKYEALKP